MLKFCPNCYMEQEFRYGMCQECGEELRRGRKVHTDEFDEEDEFTESDWGQDIETKGGDN